MKRLRVIGTVGGASLIATALLLAPALAAPTDRSKARGAPSLNSRPVGAFTPAVSDPRLAAALARRGTSLGSDFRFTPASSNPSRALRVAVRARTNAPAEATRGTLAAATSPTSATPVTAITPSSYNLGVSLGWRRFALSGDIAQSEDTLVPGRHDSARVGMSYRANRRLTGRLAVAAERNEGTQRLLREDEAYSLDVGGAYSVARNVDVTGGVRYRIARDRLEVLQRDERRDSQAVYIGTAFRF